MLLVCFLTCFFAMKPFEKEKFISIVKEKPTIYNASDPAHKDQLFLNNLWKSVAVLMGMPKEEGMYILFLTNIQSIPLSSINTIFVRWIRPKSRQPSRHTP